MSAALMRNTYLSSVPLDLYHHLQELVAKVADIEALNNSIAELQSTTADKAATIVSDSAIGFNIQ